MTKFLVTTERTELIQWEVEVDTAEQASENFLADGDEVFSSTIKLRVTDVTLAYGECPRCKGVGEYWTGRNELDTNAPITVPCHVCDGKGELSAALIKRFTEDEESRS